MEQSVMTFADATARASALSGVLREGILTYNEDTAQLEVYDGSAFVVAAPAPPAGIGSNVVQTVKTDTFTTSSTSFTPITGLSVTITPTTNTSKVLILAQISFSLNITTTFGFFKITGGNTAGFVGDANGSRVQALFGGTVDNDQRQAVLLATAVFLDAPASDSPVTYQVEGQVPSSSLFVNRSNNDPNTVGAARTASSITAIEVAA
jgi:hypothetical protein